MAGFTSELHGAFIDATMFFSLIAKLSTITWVSLPTGKSDLMKKIEKIIGWVAVVPFVLILSSCKEGPPEETAEKPTIQAPKKIVKETPDEPVVAETDSREDDRDKRRQEWGKTCPTKTRRLGKLSGTSVARNGKTCPKKIVRKLAMSVASNSWLK